jgi:hypothetical protein
MENTRKWLHPMQMSSVNKIFYWKQFLAILYRHFSLIQGKNHTNRIRMHA